jgi:hypothetical protein
VAASVPFFSLTVERVKHPKPLFLTVHFIVFDKEMGTVNRLLLKAGNRTTPTWAPFHIFI